jgi:glycosyltransferase involved in cell wall biosynthesis
MTATSSRPGDHSVNGRLELSVVVPVFNEVESLPELYDRLVKTLDNAGLQSYELIFVDDGSTDGSFARLRELTTVDARVRVIKFVRNFGQHAALSAGIECSTGEIVIFMDADLQNAPEDIPRFIAKMREGFDLVSGWRMSRQKVGLTRWLGSFVVNHVMTYSTGVFLHDHGCGYKAITRRVAQEASRYGHLRRFLVPLLLTLARSVGEVTIADHERRQGRSKYNFLHLFAMTFDFLTAFSMRPFRLVGLGGMLGVVIGFLAGVGYSLGRLFLAMPASNHLLAAIILLSFAGMQFTILGLLGEYLVRAYHEAQNLPLYTIEEDLGGYLRKESSA